MASSPWRSTVDNTLKNTQETLDRLRVQQSQYQSTSRRIADLFGDADDKDRSSTLQQENPSDIPPPLPHPSRYAAQYRGGDDAYHPSSSSPSTSPWKKYNANDANSIPPIIKELSDNYFLAKTQLKNVVVELELERSVRTDQIKNIEQRYSNQFAEMKAYVKQLQNDNDYLKASVRALESHQAFGRDPSSSPSSRSVEDAKSTFIHSESSAPLMARLVEVEGAVARQQQILKDRHTSMDGVVADLVKNKVEMEVEKMRSIAREAARDSCEDLIRLRMTAMQSIFNSEIQKVLESTGISREIAESTKKTFQALEENYARKLDLVDNKITTLQGEFKSQLRSTGESSQKELQELSHRVTKEFSQCHLEMKEIQVNAEHELHTQIESLKMDVVAKVNKVLKEQQQRKEPIQESDVRRIIEEMVGALEDKVLRLQGSSSRWRETTETWQKQLKAQIDQNQKEILSVTDATKHCEEELGERTKHMEKLQIDTDASKLKLRELETRLKQCEVNEREAAKEREEQHVGLITRLDTVESTVRPIKNELETFSKKAQDTFHKAAVLDDRVGALESKTVEIEQSVTKCTQPLQVKLETLRQSVHTELRPTLDQCVQTVKEVEIKLDQIKDTQAYQEKSTAQQLSDTRKDFDTRKREYEGAMNRDLKELEQKLMIQKEYVEKKHHSIQQEMKQMKERIGEGVSPLPSKEEVESLLDANTEKINSLISAFDRELEKLHEEMEGLRQEGTVDPPSPPAVMSPFKSERLDQLVAEMEAIKEHRRAYEEQLESLIAQQKQALHEDSTNRINGLKEEYAHQLEQIQDTIRSTILPKSQTLEDKLNQLVTTEKEDYSALRDEYNDLRTSHHSDMDGLTSRLEKVERKKLIPEEIEDQLSSSVDSLAALATSLQPYLKSSKQTVVSLEDIRDSIKGVQAQVAELDAKDKAISYEFQGTTDLLAQDQDKINRKIKTLLDSISQIEEKKVQLEAKIEAGIQKLEKEDERQDGYWGSEIKRMESRIKEKEKGIQTLETRCETLETSFQTTLSPLVVERLKQVEESIAAEHNAALLPIQGKLKGLEARVQTTEEQHEALSQEIPRSEKELETTLRRHVKEQTVEVRQYCDEQKAVIEMRLQELEGVQRERANEVKQLQTEQDSTTKAVSSLEEKLLELHKTLEEKDETAAPTVPTIDSDNGISAAAMKEVKEQVAELKGVVRQLEDSSADGLEAVADALTAFTDSLRDTVQRAIQGIGKEASEETEGIQSLDELLAYTLREIHQVQQTLSILQGGAIDTVDVVQQLQLDISPISDLQRAIEKLSKGLIPLARKNGIEESLFQVDVGPRYITQ